jgi:2-polyprenyl-6-methoxyphenol hydroxylase-like FAD-dependent oxidoreductase
MTLDAAEHSATDVLVVGGGIAGLATAVGLSRAGASVTVVEQEPDFHEVGAGLELAPNGTRVLAEWGLLDEMTSFGVKPNALVIKDAIDGHELTRQDLGAEFERRYGGPYLVAHRSDLLGILLRAAESAGVTLVTGQKIEHVETTGDRAVATSASGATFEARLVVGADGLGSTLRSALSDDEPIASGFVAYRGTCRMSEVDLDADLDNVVAFIGPGCHFVQYPIRKDTEQHGQLLNQVAVFQSPAFLRGESEWGLPDEVDAAFAACTEQIRHALQYVPRDRHWLMYDRDPISQWVDGRLLLTGDAAHPMLQYLAQGACQSIEDARVLQATVEASGVTQSGDSAAWDDAIREFTRIRAPHTARVQRTARLWGESWHVDGIARTLRNLLFSGRNPEDYRYTDWLYSDTI